MQPGIGVRPEQTLGLSQPPHPRIEVLLCCMPFGILATPSLALGLLQASIASLPVRSRQRYYSHAFARRVGCNAYNAVARRWGMGYQEVGDWVFAPALFPDCELDDVAYVELILHDAEQAHWPFLPPVPDSFLRLVLDVRRHACSFVEECVADVLGFEPRVVGITSVFQQRFASLALARRLKDRRPELVTVLGGVDCEGVRGPEIARQFPFVDAVVTGPGDVVFPEIVSRVLEGRPIEGLPGVHTPASAAHAPSGAPLSRAPQPAHLDDLPLPLLDDFFADLESTGIELPEPAYLSLQTSRGCWWGQRRHCAFCTLNGPTPTFTSKSPDRVVSEVAHFARRFPGMRIAIADSNIDRRHIDEALPRLAALGLGLDLKYETPATLSKDRLRTMRAAGVATIQPGIENLSTSVLRLMRKATSLLHNIRTLKWARELEMHAYWNFLIGFPGEPPEAYRAMERLIPLLTHLQPPQRECRFVELGRYSPLFEDGEAFGLRDIAPSPAYELLYPCNAEARARLATYFTYRYARPQNPDEYAVGLVTALQIWQARKAKSELWVLHESGRSLVWDGRSWDDRSLPPRLVVLEGLEHSLYAELDSIRGFGELVRVAAGGIDSTPSPDTVRRALAGLEERGLLVREDESYLGLAVLASSDQQKTRLLECARGATGSAMA